MRVKGKMWLNPRPSKHKPEIEADDFEPKFKRRLRIQETDDQEVDKCCWICHSVGYDKPCKTCTRVFHDSCLKKKSLQFSELRVCPECQLQSMDGTELNSKYFRAEKLKKILSAVARRCFAKKRDKTEIFVRWPEKSKKLGKIIDLEILLDYANKGIYTKTTEFYSDVKYIYHNSCIEFGISSEESKIAEQLRKFFEAELLCVEECPECYYHLYHPESECDDPFVRLCDPPHDIVWAQLTGHPYWPAKVLKVIRSIAHVRFFGEHEQSNIPIGKCFFMSENHPNIKLTAPKNSGPKSRRYKNAMDEFGDYHQLYEAMYGEFLFHPHRTPYEPLEKQSEVQIMSTEGRFNSHQAFPFRDWASMKREGHVNEDLQTSVINTETVMQHPQDDLSSHNNQAEGTTSTSGNLKDPSGVTSVNMTFFAHEAHEPEPSPNPVTAVRSLAADSAPISHPLPTIHPHIYDFYPDINGMVMQPPEVFKGADSVHRPSINPGRTSYNVTMGSEGLNFSSSNAASQTQDILSNTVIENNFLLNAENQAHLVDDDVRYIGQRNAGEDRSIDPDVILQHLVRNSEEMKFILESAAYMSKAMIVRVLSCASKNPGFTGLLSKLAVELRKTKLEKNKIQLEHNKFVSESQKHQVNHKVLQEQNQKLIEEKMELLSRITALEKEKDDATKNAKLILGGLKSRYEKNMKDTLKVQFEADLKEKDERLHEKEEKIKNMEILANKLEEENNRLLKELEDSKIKQHDYEEKLLSGKLLISSDALSEYKRTHYCCICESSAAIVCCVNTSYCSAKCKGLHAKEHSKHCKNKSNQSSVVQQTVSQQIEYRVVQKQNITVGTSSVGNSSTSVSHSESMSSTSHRKKEQICHVSQQTPPEGSAIVSSHNYPLKSKRRYYK